MAVLPLIQYLSSWHHIWLICERSNKETRKECQYPIYSISLETVEIRKEKEFFLIERYGEMFSSHPHRCVKRTIMARLVQQSLLQFSKDSSILERNRDRALIYSR